MTVLVVNTGSSSLKVSAIDDRDDTLVEQKVSLGDDASAQASDASGAAALIRTLGRVYEATAVGHRVVHSGPRFADPVLLDEDVLAQLGALRPLAPLHQSVALSAIAAARNALPDLPHVAVFDTAFFASLPPEASTYAVPRDFAAKHQIRRYGFHGTSHRYVAYRYRQLLKIPREQVRIVTLHLGNGCSACAIAGGDSVDTSMGFTPLDGLLMGTRSGDLDPSILEFLQHKEGMTLQELDTVLNKQSGLLGISGLTADMRELLAEAAEHDDRRARLAIDIFCYRVRKYIGAYLAALGGADAVVFTGGIGENSAEIRERICTGLQWFGLELDAERNRILEPGTVGQIGKDGARLQTWVIPTDEELLIARDTVRTVLEVPRPW